MSKLIINFIGNFNTGYVGEVGDSTHLVRELRNAGCVVNEVPQDIWKAYCDGEYQKHWFEKLPVPADINIICKWPHFNDEKYIEKLKQYGPVFYWVWDYMWDQGIPDWHIKMGSAADLYLGNDIRHPVYKGLPINSYYFPFDVADGSIKTFMEEKKYDVSFFGSWIGQGDRMEWLTEINKYIPIKVFSWNYQDWPDEFDASPAVYGEYFNRTVAQSKITLGFSCDPNTWGYWSNRVGKTLLAGGFLLYQYAPGMELFLRDGVEYFSSIEEAKEKIDYFLIADKEREITALKGHTMALSRFSSEERAKDLKILIERYLKTHDWKY